MGAIRSVTWNAIGGRRPRLVRSQWALCLAVAAARVRLMQNTHKLLFGDCTRLQSFSSRAEGASLGCDVLTPTNDGPVWAMARRPEDFTRGMAPQEMRLLLVVACCVRGRNVPPTLTSSSSTSTHTRT